MKPFLAIACATLALTSSLLAAPPKKSTVLIGDDPSPRKLCDASPGTFVVFPDAEVPANGEITGFKIFPGAIPDEKPAVFHLLVLRPTGTAGSYEVVFATGEIDARTLNQNEVATISESTPVKKGDILAYHGRGVAYDVIKASPNVYYPVNKFPEPGTTVELGTPKFPECPQPGSASRTYSIAAELSK